MVDLCALGLKEHERLKSSGSLCVRSMCDFERPGMGVTPLHKQLCMQNMPLHVFVFVGVHVLAQLCAHGSQAGPGCVLSLSPD